MSDIVTPVDNILIDVPSVNPSTNPCHTYRLGEPPRSVPLLAEIPGDRHLVAEVIHCCDRQRPESLSYLLIPDRGEKPRSGRKQNKL